MQSSDDNYHEFRNPYNKDLKSSFYNNISRVSPSVKIFNKVLYIDKGEKVRTQVHLPLILKKNCVSIPDKNHNPSSWDLYYDYSILVTPVKGIRSLETDEETGVRNWDLHWGVYL